MAETARATWALLPLEKAVVMGHLPGLVYRRRWIHSGEGKSKVSLDVLPGEKVFKHEVG